MFWRLRVSVLLFWHRMDKEAWAFVLLLALVLGLLGYGLRAVFAHQDDRRGFVRDFHAQHIACLARNVYFEARGEPITGQFAVAEVTMNRKAARQYPKTVCEVVYQQNWDPIRKRQVGAFSWTEFKTLPEPTGEEWRRAQSIAEAVYYSRYEPKLHGALHFHASYIKPDWAYQKKPLAKIGKHIFYR
jgi:N-acetylmuramoyl-L-alanine amidase